MGGNFTETNICGFCAFFCVSSVCCFQINSHISLISVSYKSKRNQAHGFCKIFSMWLLKICGKPLTEITQNPCVCRMFFNNIFSIIYSHLRVCRNAMENYDSIHVDSTWILRGAWWIHQYAYNEWEKTCVIHVFVPTWEDVTVMPMRVKTWFWRQVHHPHSHLLQLGHSVWEAQHYLSTMLLTSAPWSIPFVKVWAVNGGCVHVGER